MDVIFEFWTTNGRFRVAAKIADIKSLGKEKIKRVSGLEHKDNNQSVHEAVVVHKMRGTRGEVMTSGIDLNQLHQHTCYKHELAVDRIINCLTHRLPVSIFARFGHIILNNDKDMFTMFALILPPQ